MKSSSESQPPPETNLLESVLPSRDKFGFLQCISLSCPPLLSSNVSLKSVMTSVVLGDDLLPRITIEEVERLKGKLDGTGKRQNTKKVKSDELKLPGRLFFVKTRNKGPNGVYEIGEDGRNIRAEGVWKVRSIVVGRNCFKHGRREAYEKEIGKCEFGLCKAK